MTLKTKITFACFIALLLTGCALTYHPTVVQGNVVTPAMEKRLHLGMTKQKVLRVLGSPVLENPFSTNRWHYVHTVKQHKEPIQAKHLILYFRNNRLIQMKHG